MQADTLNRIKNYALRLSDGQQGKVVCPECVDRSGNKNDRCLSILNKGDHAIYNCHRCEPQLKGRVELNATQRRATAPRPAQSSPASKDEELSGVKWLRETRKLDYEDIKKYVAFTTAHFSQRRQNLSAISFIYRNEQGLQVYEKFRAIEEKLYTSGKSAPGGTDTLYLTEAIDYSVDYLVVTEGEWDALALKTLGFNAVSMPTGANVKWVPRNQNLLAKFRRVLIWFDADSKGGTVAERLKVLDAKMTRNFMYINAKKLRELYPHTEAKDANDILRVGTANSDINNIGGLHKVPEFQKIFDTCFEKYSPPYIIRPTELAKNLVRVRDGSYAQRVGIGEQALDAILSPSRGYAGVLTGIPGHGKSTWLTWYAYRLSERFGWKTVFWSPENDPTLMTAELMSMAAGRLVEGHAGAQAMTDHELETHAQWVEQNFRWVEDDEGNSDIDSILNRMLGCAYDMGGGPDFMVIDPFNFVKLPRVGNNVNEAQKIVYTKIRRFARENACFVLLVAHPKKMDEKHEDKKKDDDDLSQSEPESHEKRYKVPGMYSISGTSDLVNMANLAMTVYRDGNITRLITTKCSRKFLGSLGSCSLEYSPNNCRFTVLGNPPKQQGAQSWLDNDRTYDPF